MLTPVEMQGKELKLGRGYQKKEADEFLAQVYRDYEALYRENVELKDKLHTLNEGLNYYKDLEKTLQKTLIVAEKTAEETTSVAKKKASVIVESAQNKATAIVQEANTYFDKAQSNIKTLMQQYESYRIQCKKLADANLELLNSDAFIVNFETVSMSLPEFHSSVTASVNEELEEEKTEEAAQQYNNAVQPVHQEIAASLENTDANKGFKDENANMKDIEKTLGEKERFEEKKTIEAKKIMEEKKNPEEKKNNDDSLDNDIFEFFNLNDDE